MKITKQRLKEIIREELTSVEESTFGSAIRRRTTAQRNLATVNKAYAKAKELHAQMKAEEDPHKKEELRSQIQALADKAQALGEGSREQMMMPALSMADYEAAMATDEPRHEGGNPHETFLNKLLIAAKAQGAKTPAAAATLFGLGDDEEVVEYLADLMGNPMYKEQ